MLFLRLLVDNVVNVNFGKDLVHHTLESGPGIHEAKQHRFQLVRTITTYEVGFLLKCLVRFNLPMSLNKSMVLNTLLLSNSANISSTVGMGRLSRYKMAISVGYLTQNYGFPSFLVDRTTGELHEDSTGVMMPASSMRDTS